MGSNRIDTFLGINNRLPADALRTKEGSFVVSADNVEFDGAGHAKRRDGLTLVQAMTGGHSFWSNGTRNYLVRASTLYAVTLPTYAEVLLKVLTSNDPMFYVEHNGSVYYSNGTDSGRLDSADTYYPWGLPTPASPSCASIAGTLDIGEYQVSVSYYNNVTGEEGGLAPSVAHELATAGAIRVTLPAAATGATHVRVYVSQLNGGTVGLYSTVATGTATVDITTTTTTASGDTEHYTEPLPACTQLFVHMGCLCGVIDNLVVYSEPYRLGYYRPLSGYLRFEEDVSVAVSNKFGVYIAADKTRYFAGALATPDAVTDVLPYGAILGSSFIVPNKSSVGWMGEKGFVLAGTQGEVEALMSDRVDATLTHVYSPSYISESGGYRRVTCAGYCMNLATYAVSTYSGIDSTSASGGYATKSDGLYAFGGELDGIATIEASIGLGRLSYGTQSLKHMPNVYIDVAADNYLTLQVVAGDNTYEYLTRNFDPILTVQRFDVGKGLRYSWFDLTVSNTSGAYFELAGVTFEPAQTPRRI